MNNDNGSHPGHDRPFRVLVTGSRDWTDWRAIVQALTDAAATHPGPYVLVHGAARGADYMAAQAARKLGWEIEAHPAGWMRGNKSAGYRRNAEMVALGADLCLVFKRKGVANKGTSHCADLARKAGIPIREFWSE